MLLIFCIGELCSPIHSSVQTAAMLCSGIICCALHKLSSREGCEALAYESVYATAMLRSGIICRALHKLSSRTKIVGFVHNNG